MGRDVVYPFPGGYTVYIIPFLSHLLMSNLFFLILAVEVGRSPLLNIQDKLQQKLNGEAEVTWVDISEGKWMWLKLLFGRFS